MRSAILTILLMLFPVVTTAGEVPMWEGIAKTPAMLKADKELIAAAKRSGGRKYAATRANGLGWKYLAQRKPEMAMKRFNQAWLLDPSNGNVYWGFAIALHQQGRPIAEVNRFFNQTRRAFRNNRNALVELYADQGQVYGERRMFKQSIAAFEKALELNPKHRKSLRGIAISSNAIGNTKGG